MQAQRCYFTQLPVELLNTVFTSITDLNTLANAALSCRSLYATFKGNEKRIIKEFLINHIGIDVLPEAILAYNCLPGPMRRSKMHLTGPSMDRDRELMMCITDFLEDIRANKLVRPVVDSLDFGIDEAFALANTHFYVVAFTERFLEKCSITTGVKLRQSFRLSPPSPAEKARIARAFYRFELFRRLLALVWSESYDKDCTPVLHQFQPWELCQLGCIHDFLAYEVIPAFVTTVRQDGIDKYDDFEFGSDYDTDMTAPWIQHILSLGLMEIYRLTTMRSFHERKAVLHGHRRHIDIESVFLHDELVELNQDGYPPQSHPSSSGKPFHDDGDIGPKQIWQHSKRNDDDMEIYELGNWKHRAWGYVMWDNERLQALGILDLPWSQTRLRSSLRSVLMLQNDQNIANRWTRDRLL